MHRALANNSAAEQPSHGQATLGERNALEDVMARPDLWDEHTRKEWRRCLRDNCLDATPSSVFLIAAVLVSMVVGGMG